MPLLMIVAAIAAGALGAALIFYIVTRYYETRQDRTYMTHDERGFKRALEGKGVLWDFEERIVKGPTAPHVDFVAIDPATGGRNTRRLLDAKTGAINLRPQYCAPLPFHAATKDGHKIVVDPRVQFSINKKLLNRIYEIQEFSMALDTRIQGAFRAEIGKRRDEELRADLDRVAREVLQNLRQAELDGDEEGEQGMAIGAAFHTVNFDYTQPDEFAGPVAGVLAGAGITPEQQAARVAQATSGVLSFRPTQLDLIADVFEDRPAAETSALLAMLEMQTRQNIAEALARSGQLVVLTPGDLGLLSAAAAREAAAARRIGDAPSPQPNGGVRTEGRP